MPEARKPIVLITGAAGNIGRSLAAALADAYQVVGLDRPGKQAPFPLIEVDFSDAASVHAAIGQFQREHGGNIASVVHLAAYFDFSGEENPLYEQINVEGTGHLLRALQQLEVAQFVYSGTMLVHAPGRPGEPINEDTALAPAWAYPRSKAAAEQIIRNERGPIPAVLLRLAGLYDHQTCVPTLAHQIARIHSRDLQSHFFAGPADAGQSMLHREDMLDAFRRAIDRRTQLPEEVAILVGEPRAPGYGTLQDELGYLIHGIEDWPTLRLPQLAAAAGAWAQEQLEPVIPDALDGGEKPFVKPFMMKLADDHYELDVRRASHLLGWQPRHWIRDELPAMVKVLKQDPAGWYEANGITPPAQVSEAMEAGEHPEQLRQRHEQMRRQMQADNRWAHFVNIALGIWLVTQPPLIGVGEPLLAATEVALGVLVILFASLSLSWQLGWARWACAGLGVLVMAAPFVFWTENPAAYLSDTLTGALIFGFAVCTRPEVGPSALAAMHGPESPPGWNYNPSSWTQRLPIVLVALAGLQISRYLAAYQLGHIDGVWEPFFAGSAADPRNGTEEIITSFVSAAWPVADAAVGGWTYVLEILTGLVGTRARWRTMPWLVLVFGLMIAPLGITSIFFIIIQPVLIGTWSTLTLIAAGAVLVQIPYSLDELLATLQFMRRRVRAGRSLLRVFLFGDTDDGPATPVRGDDFSTRPSQVLREMFTGGVSLPWNLAAAAALGIWLMCTRLTLGAEGGVADADHVLGALVLTVISVAAAEVARLMRLLLLPLALALTVMPFILEATTASTVNSVLCAVALALLCLRRGPIVGRYATWQRWVV